MLVNQRDDNPIAISEPVNGLLLNDRATLNTECFREQLMICIEQLTKKYQVVMHLHYIEGKSCPEIAQLFAIPLETIRSRVRRGNQKVRKLLKNENIELVAYKAIVCLESLAWSSIELEIRIRKLPNPYRTIMKLHYLEHLSYSEIALLLGKRINTIKSQVHRGRKLLLDE